MLLYLLLTRIASDAQEIKKGYSALFMEQSSGAGTGQGLSFGGSCFSEFTVAPIMECTDDACDVSLTL